MNDRSRQALAWLAVAAVVFLGLLLLYFVASQARPPTDPARQDVSWPVLQTIVAFALFDFALLAGLVIARLGSRPASLSPKALLATAAAAALLSLVLLVVVLGWPVTLAILLWTLVLIAGFALMLAMGMAWSASRQVSGPAQPAPSAATQEQSAGDAIAETAGQAAAKHPASDAADPLAYLVTLLGGDREAAERLVAMEQTLDPGATFGECIARAANKLERDRT